MMNRVRKGISAIKVILIIVALLVVSVVAFMFLGPLLLPQVLNTKGIVMDAASKAMLQIISDKIESNREESGGYPEKSDCVENIAELSGLLKESYGSADFKVASCPMGFYYQYIPDKNYVLWAKMGDPKLGNTDDTPDVVEKLLSNRVAMAIGGKGGTYFIIIKPLQTDEEANPDSGDSMETSEDESMDKPPSSRGVKRPT